MSASPHFTRAYLFEFQQLKILVNQKLSKAYPYALSLLRKFLEMH